MRSWTIFIVMSVVIHGSLASTFLMTKPYEIDSNSHVKIRVVSITPEPEPTPTPIITEEPPPPEASPPEIPPRPQELPPPTPQPEQPPARSERAQESSLDPVIAEPVQGLSPGSLGEGGGGIAVPVGNTLMIEDRGIRLKAEEVVEFNQDLSAAPQLILSSMLRPKYTDDALDIGLEGVFEVAVYVDDQGNVVDAQLDKGIGYGMDVRVINAAKSARFHPARDRFGRPIAQRSYIRFALQLD